LVRKCAASAAAHLTHFSAENFLVSSDGRFRPQKRVQRHRQLRLQCAIGAPSLRKAV